MSLCSTERLRRDLGRDAGDPLAEPSLLILVGLFLRAVAVNALRRATAEAEHEGIEARAIPVAFLAFPYDPHTRMLARRAPRARAVQASCSSLPMASWRSHSFGNGCARSFSSAIDAPLTALPRSAFTRR